MTVSFNITTAGHLCEVDKDRTRMFADKPDFVITSETGKMIRDWCEKGIEPVVWSLDVTQQAELQALINTATIDQARKDAAATAIAAAKSQVEIDVIKKTLLTVQPKTV
jgi:hypothetical protein